MARSKMGTSSSNTARSIKTIRHPAFVIRKDRISQYAFVHRFHGTLIVWLGSFLLRNYANRPSNRHHHQPIMAVSILIPPYTAYPHKFSRSKHLGIFTLAQSSYNFI